MLKNNIYNTAFEVSQAFGGYEGIYPNTVEYILLQYAGRQINFRHDHQSTQYKPKILFSSKKNLDIWFYLEVNKLDSALGQVHLHENILTQLDRIFMNIFS